MIITGSSMSSSEASSGTGTAAASSRASRARAVASLCDGCRSPPPLLPLFGACRCLTAKAAAANCCCNNVNDCINVAAGVNLGSGCGMG